MVVYLAITALIVLCTMQWAVSALTHYHRITHSNSAIAATTCALDVWMRDMRRAIGPFQRDHDRWIWQVGDTYIAWYLKETSLLRAEGTYAHGIWHERVQSLMTEGVASVTMDYKQPIASITVQLAATSSWDKPYCCTRNVRMYVADSCHA